MATLDVDLTNKTTSSNVYAYITGQAIDSDNALFLLSSDGQTPYLPTSPSAPQSALSTDVAIPLGAPGSTKSVKIPHIAGGRLWFCVNDKLEFVLNPGPALVEPSVTNNADPNINKEWGFCEFTWNSDQFYGNISYVDFVSIPIAIGLESNKDPVQHVSGMDQNGLASVISGLQAQDDKDKAGWSQLLVKNGDTPLRVLAPNNGKTLNPDLFGNYFDSYIDQVYTKYGSEDLSVDTQTGSGVVKGRVSNNTLSFGSDGPTFAKPTTAQVFSNDGGPFQTGISKVADAIIPRLAAGFNRSTLLNSDVTPATNESTYYQGDVTNHYARIVHAVNLDGKGYTFPYDDVTPSGAADLSGKVQSGDPKLWCVAVGGNGTSKTAPQIPSSGSGASGNKGQENNKAPGSSAPGVSVPAGDQQQKPMGE